MTLKDMVETKRQKRMEAEAEALRIKANKEAKAQLKEEKETAAANLKAAWSLCGDFGAKCKCGMDECMMTGLQMCPTCERIIPHACRKQACVAARRAVPLMAIEPPPEIAVLTPAAE